ncbi:hypothetical protein EVAR_25697_1 [Eumeta japonica]|uniref:Mos1 transposase HTH domain-containing protein n=1 Tax=Eumeta variegata TaxID=151549 RepID=A0A4C1WG58_EUMVA|nr:hypothetical protein EVAR_25697_1 [Eumeta japonica]
MRENFRAIIYLNTRRGSSPDERLSKLVDIYDVEALGQTTIDRWYVNFQRGRGSSNAMLSTGLPITAITLENIADVQKIIRDDRHAMYEQIRATIRATARFTHPRPVLVTSNSPRVTPRLVTTEVPYRF